jgi:hypothetical protein
MAARPRTRRASAIDRETWIAQCRRTKQLEDEVRTLRALVDLERQRSARLEDRIAIAWRVAART